MIPLVNAVSSTLYPHTPTMSASPTHVALTKKRLDPSDLVATLVDRRQIANEAMQTLEREGARLELLCRIFGLQNNPILTILDLHQELKRLQREQASEKEAKKYCLSARMDPFDNQEARTQTFIHSLRAHPSYQGWRY